MSWKEIKRISQLEITKGSDEHKKLLLLGYSIGIFGVVLGAAAALFTEYMIKTYGY